MPFKVISAYTLVWFVMQKIGFPKSGDIPLELRFEVGAFWDS